MLSIQIGRPLRAESEVVARCPLQLPVVAQVPPVLDGGEPFPTLYWLTCPLARRRIARLEASGGVREMDALVRSDDEFGGRLLRAHKRYEATRDAMVGATVHRAPTGGVAGTKGDGVKCLHAHFADHAAGNANPVGEWVDEKVGALNCTSPCVSESEHALRKNPHWVEPERDPA